MMQSDKRSCPAVRFLASTLLAGLAVACSESSNSDKTDGTLGETTSTDTAQTTAPSASVTSPMASGSSTNTTTPNGTAAATTATATTPPTQPTTAMTATPTPSGTGGNEEELGAGGTGSDDSVSEQPGTEPDSTDVEPTTAPTDEASDSDTELPATAIDETEPGTADETETTTAPGVPDAPQCAAVIKGELTDCGDTSDADPNFSFFTASRVSMVALSENPLGFGGNLGGLECADQICALIAECVAPGNSQTWHAFLSTSEVDAKDRIGSGPWYDVVGTKLADDLTGLIGVDRPTTTDGVVNHNLPNEFGCENLTPACTDVKEDNHHVMTGSNPEGVYTADRTCDDWTSTDATPGTGPAVGLSWERQLFSGGGGGGGGGSQNWLNFANESGCAPGGNLTNDPPMGSNDGTVGSGGGYGAIYCFAVTE